MRNNIFSLPCIYKYCRRYGYQQHKYQVTDNGVGDFQFLTALITRYKEINTPASAITAVTHLV